MTTAYFLIVIPVIPVLLLITIFYGSHRVRKVINLEKEELFGSNNRNSMPVSNSDLESLPSNLSAYLKKVGVVGKYHESNVSFKQQGQIKTAQNKKWKHFKANQYMSGKNPGFIWSAASFPLIIRDKSVQGIGEVTVNLLGFKELAKFRGTSTNHSALVRCLGEFLFFPIGFLSKDISWETHSHDALKASLKVNDVVAQGVFYFNDYGLLYRFEAKRHMGEKLENFTGIAEDYTMLGGMYIPSKMKARWNLDKGDFDYFYAQITDYRID